MSDKINPITVLSEAFSGLEEQNRELRESLEGIRAQMAVEDRDWMLLTGQMTPDENGLTLEELHAVSEKLEPKVAAGSLPKRAVDLHSGFVWGRGCFIEGTERPKGKGRPTGIRAFFIDATNQESVFGDIAREELQKARFVEGNVLAVCNTRTKKVNRIPFKQITNVKVDPDYPENIIAYQRTWDTGVGQDSVKKVWIYTHRFDGKRQKSFTNNKETVPVSQDETIVDLRVNRQVGHVLGIPDGLAGILWSDMYTRIVKYGETVQESMAKILYRVTNKTAAGVKSTGVKMSSFGGHGGTASMAEGQELTAVSTAGRGYDFASGRPVAALAASAWNVSNMDLLNDSSAAGSSYGSANALVGGNRNAMLLMQKEWAEFYKSIFQVMGYDRPTITFEPFEAPDKYRELQAITLGSVALHDEEYRMLVMDALDVIGNASDIPETLKMRNEPQETAAQQASPDQGRASGTGTGNGDSGGQGANDQRSDTISQSESIRREMANEDFLNRFEHLLERFEAAKSVI